MTTIARAVAGQPKRLQAYEKNEALMLDPSLVRITPAGRHPSFFLVHDGGGAIPHRRLAQRLGSGQPASVVQTLVVARLRAPVTIEAIASHCLDVVRSAQRHGPYVLGGSGNGGLVAWEMARRLEAQGETVELLVMIASAIDPRFARLQRFALAIARTARVSDETICAAFGRVRSGLRAIDGKHPARRVALALDAIAAGYVARPWRGHVVLFWPGDYPTRNPDDPSVGWARLARSVDVQIVPGTRAEILARHADLVGDALAPYLRGRTARKAGVSVRLVRQPHPEGAAA